MPHAAYPGQWDYPLSTGTLQRRQRCSRAKRTPHASGPVLFVQRLSDVHHHTDRRGHVGGFFGGDTG